MFQPLSIDTRFGAISVLDSGGDGRPLLLVHGNSSCKEVFDAQFAAPELAGLRLIAPDLPGHGASDDASDPDAAYTFAGYAQVLETLIDALGIPAPVIFGWSLGGHAALELIGRGKTPVAGLMISGTPPVTPTPECLMQAFNIDPAAENLTAKRDFSEEDAQAYALHTGGVDGEVDHHLLEMVKRTDGRARETMFASVLAGAPLDERQILRSMQVPLAVVNGAEDPFVRPEFFDTLNAPTLWDRGILRLEGAGHAPFRQTPVPFNRLLAAFAHGC